MMRAIILDGRSRTDFGGRRHGPFRCDQFHDWVPELGYVQAQDDAKDRMKCGESQTYCQYCSKWVWNSFWHHVPGEDSHKHIAGRHFMLVPYKGDPIKLRDPAVIQKSKVSQALS